MADDTTTYDVGYDLSGHQAGIDIERLIRERSPVWLAFKLTEAQGFVDSVSIALAERAAALNVPCSGYCFAWANRDPKAQAHRFVNEELLATTTANPVVDIEGVYDPIKKRIVDVPEVGPRAALACYRALVEEIEQAIGKNVVVYTSPGFIQTFFSAPELVDSDDAAVLAERSLWVACYGPRLVQPVVPLFWARRGRTWSGWQWDGGMVTRSPDGFKLDANRIANLANFVPGFRPQPIELPPDPRGPNASVQEILDLVARPGGQTL